MGVQRVTPHSVGRCHEVTEGTALLGVIPLAGRCARKGRAHPEKQSGQQSESGRPLLTSPPRLDRQNYCPIDRLAEPGAH